MRWERELEWRQKQRNARSGSSSGPSQPNKGSDGSRSPYDRRPSSNESMSFKDKDKRHAGKEDGSISCDMMYLGKYLKNYERIN